MSAPITKHDLPYLAAEALHHTEIALEAVRDAEKQGELSEFWARARVGLERSYDALSVLRRSQ